MEKVRFLSQVDLLGALLPKRVASPLSLTSLSEDVQTSPKTIINWMDLLARNYYCFRVMPYHLRLERALKKESKYYLWDWSEIEEEGKRFENMVGSHLLKFTDFYHDVLGIKIKPWYLRDREGREVDFLVTWGDTSWFMVECKLVNFDGACLMGPGAVVKMRKLVFGYSTRCNVKCEHCVAAGDFTASTMDNERAKAIIVEMAQAGVGGISFSAGEPLLYLNEIAELLTLCRQLAIYSRVVTNSFWAATPEAADNVVSELKNNGLCQLRLSYSRWHQKNIARQNILNAAQSCQKNDLPYFISFVTDFSKADEEYEQFLRDNELTFFPEPVIYAGRADYLPRRSIQTDYQANCCEMNPYLTPELDMYACCDAGSHFSETNFFFLGNLNEYSVEELFSQSETDGLYNFIRSMGLTNIASFSGMNSREIITYSKCELCRKLFNSPETLARLGADTSKLAAWSR